ncbi:hypothetical protein [Paenibacillus eucommiae]|uniref:Uncharacterized protein n=1 Tax=Paenibacillus eucommiae TaxID=1355755 RepID=A0ABS4J372_9BACL|nr:hypothetical protein [Paenibacillus eucommiae]MBP1993269.1 hypothetical protein [Paenibacillus eucommiae]
MRGLKHVILMGATVGMLFYLLPKLEFDIGFTAPAIFAIVWTCLALLVVAAHLHELLGVNDEKRQDFKRIKAVKRWQLEQMLQGKRNRRNTP